MGGVEPIKAMLQTYNLEPEQKDYLLQKILDLIMRQCLGEAREIVPLSAGREDRVEPKSTGDGEDQLLSGSRTATEQT